MFICVCCLFSLIINHILIMYCVSEYIRIIFFNQIYRWGSRWFFFIQSRFGMLISSNTVSNAVMPQDPRDGLASFHPWTAVRKVWLLAVSPLKKKKKTLRSPCRAAMASCPPAWRWPWQVPRHFCFAKRLEKTRKKTNLELVKCPNFIKFQ